jgi:cell division protein FtsI (penicillin-binding protein 3)
MALRKSIIRKYTIVYYFVLALFLLAGVRLVMVITVERDNWLAQLDRVLQEDRVIEPERGNLYAADGSLITATIPRYKLYMDLRVEALHTPKGLKFFEDNIDSLSICLSKKFEDKSAEEYKRMINDARKVKNGRLRLSSRSVSYIELKEIEQYPLLRAGVYKSGFFFEKEVCRENLYGSLARRTLGNVYRSSGKGQYGLELYYDSLLTGEPGLSKGHLVGRRQWVFVEEKAAERGVDIYTTLDLEMQDVCETVMLEKLDVIKAKNACVILMEVATGEIKAMVNLQRAEDGSYFEGKNMAVSDLSEPGSTFKTMSLMVALDDELCDTSDVLNINHGQWPFYDKTMYDHNWKSGGYDSLTVSEILAQSSNVGVSRIIDEKYRSKPRNYIDAILATGFAQPIDIGIPGTVAPRIPMPGGEGWSGLTLPWMSIGYEVLVPPIYTLNFYNAIANGGKMMRPYLVREIRRDEKVLLENEPEVINKNICKATTLSKVQGMLEGVVIRGTAKSSKSKYFAIAGKTGTAQLQGRKDKHQVSFCGYFPADNPLYSCIVVVKEPQMNPNAAFMCGDVFKQIAEYVYSKEVRVDVDDLVEWNDDLGSGYNLPLVKSGRREIIEDALNELDVKWYAGESDWVVMKESQSSLVAEELSLSGSKMPNVIGMGAMDAVYLLESYGLRVKLIGKGSVYYQSLRKGADIVIGSIVELKLR